VAEVKFDDSRAKILEAEFSKILPKIITKEESQKSEWIWCISAIPSTLETLGQKQYFTDAQIVELQLEIYIWEHDGWYFMGRRA
jgi:hypothetical protein